MDLIVKLNNSIIMEGKVNIESFKRNLGIVLFSLSIVFLIYLLFTPLNHVLFKGDEFYTQATVNFPLKYLLSITINDVHPPLYYLMLKAFTAMLAPFMMDPVHVMKVFSTIPYVIILIISATRIRKEYGWLTAGVLCFALGVMSDFPIYYVVVRMYSWAVLFLFLTFLCYRNVLNKPDTQSWVLFTLFSLLGSYTHYFVAISTILLYLILLAHIYKNNRDEVRRWLISAACCIIAYLPWVWILLGQMKRVHDTFWIKTPTSATFIRYLLYFATNEKSLTAVLMAVAALAMIFFIYLLFKNYMKGDDDNNYVLTSFVLYFATIIVGTVISLTFKPILLGLYLLPVIALLWFGFAILIGKLTDYRLIIISLIFIILLGGASFGYTAEKTSEYYTTGTHHMDVFDEINEKGNTVLIHGEMGLMEFERYFSDADIYATILNDTRDVDESYLHDRIDFTEINKTKVSGLFEGRDNVYFINAWGDDFIKENKSEIDSIVDAKIYKIN